MTVYEPAEEYTSDWKKWEYSRADSQCAEKEAPTVETIRSSIDWIETQILPELASLREKAEVDIFNELDHLQQENEKLLLEVEAREEKVRRLFKEYSSLKVSYAAFCKQEIAKSPVAEQTVGWKHANAKVYSGSKRGGVSEARYAEPLPDVKTTPGNDWSRKAPVPVRDPASDDDDFKPAWASGSYQASSRVTEATRWQSTWKDDRWRRNSEEETGWKPKEGWMDMTEQSEKPAWKSNRDWTRTNDNWTSSESRRDSQHKVSDWGTYTSSNIQNNRWNNRPSSNQEVQVPAQWAAYYNEKESYNNQVEPQRNNQSSLPPHLASRFSSLPPAPTRIPIRSEFVNNSSWGGSGSLS